MAEYKLFEGKVPHVSTFEFHQHRDRAPHLEQPGHQARLYQAAAFVRDVADYDGEPVSVVDLGCGDGGLLSLLQQYPDQISRCWGYDFTPSTQEGWVERGVNAELKDAFGKDRNKIQYGRVAVTTEVLEHLADPHGAVKFLAGKVNYLVASSPVRENDVHHDVCHAWAWDMEGYKNLMENNGFRVANHFIVDDVFQVLWAERV
jgi:SAM-dependent methyltransferase